MLAHSPRSGWLPAVLVAPCPGPGLSIALMLCMGPFGAPSGLCTSPRLLPLLLLAPMPILVGAGVRQKAACRDSGFENKRCTCGGSDGTFHSTGLLVQAQGSVHQGHTGMLQQLACFSTAILAPFSTGTLQHWHASALPSWHPSALAPFSTGMLQHWHASATGMLQHWHASALACFSTGMLQHWHASALACFSNSVCGALALSARSARARAYSCPRNVCHLATRVV